MSDQKPSDKRSLNLEPLNHFMKQMDRLFTDQSGKGLLQNLDDFFIHSKSFGGFPTELKENDSEYTIIAQMPGVKKNHIDIEVLPQYVTISVREHESITKEDKANSTYVQKSVWKNQSRTIPLTKPIDQGKVTATYKDGLLTI